MVLKEDKQILKEFDDRLKKDSGGIGSSIKPREIIILLGVILVAFVLAYYSTNDKKYFDWMIYAIIGALILLIFAKSRRVERGFILDHEARVRLGRILLEYQNSPSDRFLIPQGRIIIDNMYDEDDLYTYEQKYLVYQVFTEDVYSRRTEFTAKVNWKGDLMHWVEKEFPKNKQRIKYLLPAELQAAREALGYRRNQ